MTDAAAIGVLAAFAAGIVSFLSPCVLPIVPGYVSFVAGGSVQHHRHLHAEARLAAVGMSALFVAGFSAVFIAFGASASALGQLLLRYRFEANLVAGVIAAFVLGVAFAFGWTPRIGPVLGAILAVSAASTSASDAGLQVAGGLVMVALGIAMITGRMTDFSLWLLESFPALGRIG